MGYYTDIGICLDPRKDKIEELKFKVNVLKEKLKQHTPDNNLCEDENCDICWFCWYDDITIDKVCDDFYIEFNDYNRKWYDADRFYNFIKDFVEAGYIQGKGEDSDDIWRIEFDGKGNWKRKVIQWVDADIQRESKIRTIIEQVGEQQDRKGAI